MTTRCGFDLNQTRDSTPFGSINVTDCLPISYQTCVFLQLKLWGSLDNSGVILFRHLEMAQEVCSCSFSEVDFFNRIQKVFFWIFRSEMNGKFNSESTSFLLGSESGWHWKFLFFLIQIFNFEILQRQIRRSFDPFNILNQIRRQFDFCHLSISLPFAWAPGNSRISDYRRIGFFFLRLCKAHTGRFFL